MEPGDSIQRLGFARWYERRLIEGHAWFVSGVLCLVVIPACFEVIGERGPAPRLLAYCLLAAAALVIGVYAVVRYGRILGEAEAIGERATCGGCGAYARFRMVSASDVSCRKCGKEWRLIG